MFQANAGMQHALGEGARYATLCIPTGTGCNTPTDARVVTADVEQGVRDEHRDVRHPDGDDAGDGQCTHCKDLTVTYTVTPNFLFFNGPPVTLTRTKRVYQSPI